VRARLVPETQIRVIRSSGVNLERFLPVVPETEVRPLRVLLAARLLWEKGIGEYIEAARLLRAQGRTIQFVIAGSPDPGNPRSVSREQVQSWVAENLVDWRGHVEDMPALMRSVDVIALPSYYREGVPKSLIEAAACGLAVGHDEPAGLPRSRQRTWRGRLARRTALRALAGRTPGAARRRSGPHAPSRRLRAPQGDGTFRRTDGDSPHHRGLRRTPAGTAHAAAKAVA
jgi:glycosyltransferase involved in cell wall biosynthesis